MNERYRKMLNDAAARIEGGEKRECPKCGSWVLMADVPQHVESCKPVSFGSGRTETPFAREVNAGREPK